MRQRPDVEMIVAGVERVHDSSDRDAANLPQRKREWIGPLAALTRSDRAPTSGIVAKSKKATSRLIRRTKTAGNWRNGVASSHLDRGAVFRTAETPLRANALTLVAPRTWTILLAGRTEAPGPLAERI